jgi:uncharacterized iron-regulated membrane protein
LDQLLGVVPEATSGATTTSLAKAVELARASEPGKNAVYLYQEPAEHPGLAFVGLASQSRRLEDARPVAIDRRSGSVLPKLDLDGSFTGIVLRLHAQLLAGPVGSLVVGAIGVALLVSLVTGAIVYGPIMRRFAFGLIRWKGAARTSWADLHKLLGAATFGWTFVVTVTGVLLSLGSLLLQLFSMTELAALGAPYAREPVVVEISNVDTAVAAAESATAQAWSIVALPGSDLASPRHFTVLLQGGTGFNSRMLTMALVDATKPTVAEVHDLPLYLKALLLSEPLHFGDYGGLPLKITWTLFAVVTIVLSGSGVVVFLKARRDRGARGRTEAMDADATRAQEVLP